MASPVDTSVKFHLSTMSNAVQLTGTAGSLIGLLDAFLVTGYDSKAVVSLTVTGGVATATFVGDHSALPHSVILVDGVTGPMSALNGEQKITAKPTASSLQWATTLGDGTATGTITIKMAAAGWTKVFSGTNKAVYKSADPAANGHFLRVDDSNANYASVRGYENMTDVDTGTGMFPTTGIAVESRWWKNSVSSAAVRYQFAVDSRMLLIAVNAHSSYNMSALRGFGDFIPLAPGGDVWSTGLNFTTFTSAFNEYGYDFSWHAPNIGAVSMPRDLAGVGAAVNQGVMCANCAGQTSVLASGINGAYGPFPSRVDGKLRLGKQYVNLSIGAQDRYATPRAEVPGVRFALNSEVRNFLDTGDLIDGADDLAGRKLLALRTSEGNASPSYNPGITFIDVTGPWR